MNSTHKFIFSAVIVVTATFVHAAEIKYASSDCTSCESASDDCCGQVGCGCGSCCKSPIWLRMDGLIWWTKGADVPVLVSTSGPNTPRAQAGVLGQGATALFGGGRIQDEARFGGRVRAGMWLDDCECDAFEVSWLTVGGASGADFTAGPSTGNPIIARPFFNQVTNQEDALLDAYTGVVDGSVTVNLSSELHSGTATYRTNWRDN